MLLSVVDGNTSEEFNRSDFDYKWYLHAKKSIFSPRLVGLGVGPVGWAEGGIRLGLFLRLRSSASGHPLDQF